METVKFTDPQTNETVEFTVEEETMLNGVKYLLVSEEVENGDFEAFLEQLRRSGRSSWMYLQNISPAGAVEEQAVAVSLGLCDMLLQGRGAFRVHGGGFAGTVQAFVPLDMLERFRAGIERVLGEGSCHVLSIRPEGGIRVQ